MKEAACVFLRAEIKAEDIYNIIGWLRNENVIRYLNESRSAPDSLLYLLDNTPPHMLTYSLNQTGRFYLVCDEQDMSIGFLRFRDLPGNRYEVVYVIGEERLWGQGFGKAALSQALNMLFFENRAKSVTAKICHKNSRSIHTAIHCGMQAVRVGDVMSEYSVTIDEYLKKLA